MEFLGQLEGIISNKLAIVKGVWSLFKLETQLARLSIVPLLISLSAIIALILVIWLTAMLLIGYLMTVFLSHSIWLSMTAVLVINICLLFAAFRILIRSLRRMSFEQTRACLAVDNMELQREN